MQRLAKGRRALIEIPPLCINDSQKVCPAEGLGVQQVRSLVTDLRLLDMAAGVQHHSQSTVGGGISWVCYGGGVRLHEFCAQTQGTRRAQEGSAAPATCPLGSPEAN